MVRTVTTVLSPFLWAVGVMWPIAISPAADPMPLLVRPSDSNQWQYVAVHSDEFETDDIDREKWNVDTEDFGVWSWQPENVIQRMGAMHLRMVPQEHQRGNQTLHYTSGMARNDKTITYGYFEAKVKGCSRYPGASPAFWLYSIGPLNRYQAQDGETVAHSEIDIIELQQSEFDSETKTHFPVTRIDCNLRLYLASASNSSSLNRTLRM